MEFKSEAFGVSFTLPSPITVRLQLNYTSVAILARGKELFEQYWLAALSVIRDWHCELIPDPQKLDLEQETNPRIAEIVVWVGMEVKKHMDRLEDVPKN